MPLSSVASVGDVCVHHASGMDEIAQLAVRGGPRGDPLELGVIGFLEIPFDAGVGSEGRCEPEGEVGSPAGGV